MDPRDPLVGGHDFPGGEVSLLSEIARAMRVPGEIEIVPESVWDAKKRRMTNDEVLERLDTAPANLRVPGRTLIKGHSWDGRDLPGHGKAAQRRLRQIARGQHPEVQR